MNWKLAGEVFVGAIVFFWVSVLLNRFFWEKMDVDKNFPRHKEPGEYGTKEETKKSQ